MDKSNWDTFDCNKMELDSSAGFQDTELDVNEIADDMFRINDDKLIGMVGDDFLTQFGLDDAFNSEIFSTDTSFSNQSSTFNGSLSDENKEECKVFDELPPTVPDLLIDDAPKTKKLKVQKEIKTEVDNVLPPIVLQEQNTTTPINHSAIILPLNTIAPNPGVAQLKTTVHQQKIGLNPTLVQPTSLVAIQSLPTVMYNYTEANGAIKSQVSLKFCVIFTQFLNFFFIFFRTYIWSTHQLERYNSLAFQWFLILKVVPNTNRITVIQNQTEKANVQHTMQSNVVTERPSTAAYAS